MDSRMANAHAHTDIQSLLLGKLSTAAEQEISIHEPATSAPD